jgi:hypothetical protein
MQVALYLQSRDPGGVAYVKGVGLQHKDIHVVVEPVNIRDGYRAWLGAPPTMLSGWGQYCTNPVIMEGFGTVSIRYFQPL